MAFNYKIRSNFGDAHQQSPYWFAAVIPFKHRNTFNHVNDSLSSVVSPVHATVETDPIIIIDNDCIQWETSSSKESHISGFSAKLVHSDKDYTNILAPEDWFLFWVFDDFTQFQQTKNKVSKLQRANGFQDGLKFVGRIQSVFKTMVRNQNGAIQVLFDVSANGFTELDSVMYFNEAVAQKYNNLQDQMSDFGSSINDFVLNGAIVPQLAIPKLISICLGVGPTQKVTKIAETNVQVSPNKSYLIPNVVMALLAGVDAERSKSVSYSYSDLLKRYVGIQKFGKAAVTATPSGIAETQLSQYVTEYAQKGPHTYTTKHPILGDFYPTPIQFNGSIWSILKSFLNEPVNEMFDCLRLDSEGYVMPSIIVRQLPFSSRQYADTHVYSTAFLDLPRWEIDSNMIQQVRVGMSNSLKFNYVHLLGLAPWQSNQDVHNISFQYVVCPPLADDADIRRSGLRPLVAQLSSRLSSNDSKINDNLGVRWQRLLADAMMGGHLLMSGVVSVAGIQAPICEGDNCVVGNVVYHIERVIHSGGIDLFGKRSFNTTLHLSHGVSLLNDNNVINQDDGTVNYSTKQGNFAPTRIAFDDETTIYGIDFEKD